MTQLEVELNPINRTSFIIDEGNYFDCNVEGLTDIGGVKRFTCSRPTCSDESKPFCNLDEDRNFIIAYGEGQFRGNETYHSSRGGCAYTFKRDKPIQCIISQKEVTYSLPLPKPNTPGPTAFYTSFDTTFDNESFGVKVSCNIYIYCALLSFCIALF